MKNKCILGGFAALTARATSASADQTVDITGATAFRTASITTIIASYGAGLDDFAGTCIDGSAAWKADLAFLSATRSCGRFGPARLGSMVDRSSSSVSE